MAKGMPVAQRKACGERDACGERVGLQCQGEPAAIGSRAAKGEPPAKMRDRCEKGCLADDLPSPRRF